MKEASIHANFTPQGWHTVTPKLVVDDGRRAVEFLKQVFAATGDYVSDRPSVISIGDSMIMIGEVGIRSAVTSFLYVYVQDADATYQRALNAGARSLEKPMDTPYGDRRCMIEDQWGNTWQIATHMGK